MPLSRSVIVAGDALYQYAKNKGDLITSSGSGPTTLPVGANGDVLYADSTTLTGLRWGTLSYEGIQHNGVALPAEPTLNFIGSAVAIADDAVNTRTNVTFASTLNDIAGLTPTANSIIYGNGTNYVSGVPALTHVYYVSKSGNDATGNGSVLFPYLTVQAALTAIGDATTQAQFEDVTQRFYVVKVAPGQYTETLTIPTRPVIVIELDSAEIVGNVTQTFNASFLGGALNCAQVVFQGNAALGIHTGLNMGRTGITGNITMTRSAGANNFTSLGLMNCGVSGNITFDSPAISYTGFLFTQNVNIGGSIIPNQSTININCYLNNDDTPGSTDVGGAGGVGQVTLRNVKNVNFNGVVTTGSASAAFRLVNVTFAAVANNFTGCTSTISADANSYASYYTNVPTKGTGTITLLDKADGIDTQYTPVHYSTAGVDVKSHLTGIDNALASALGAEKWVAVTANTTMTASSHYIGNAAGTLTFTLPASLNVGDTFGIMNGTAPGWTIAQNAGQTIHMGNVSATTGAGGSLSSTNQGDTVQLVAISTTDLRVSTAVGNITIV